MGRKFAFLFARGATGKGLGTCYSAAYMSQTRDQQAALLQSRKWQLTGISYNGAAAHYVAIHCPR